MSAPAIAPAAQYLRMSTEHQRYSLESQARAIAAYAGAHGYDVVASYVDAGVSGLDFDRREGLRRLITEVAGGGAAFRTVLVYDVSRWGRFQDPDEAAHYEFLCRAAGVSIVYCGETFPNDGSLATTLLKHLKRAMAAEYLRELSLKVARQQRAVALQGFWPSGPAPFGYRRQMVRYDGAPGPSLERHEHKALHGFRCRLVKGPPAEVRLVRRIFREYATGQVSSVDLARQLSSEGRASPFGGVWRASTILTMLRNEAYLGVSVFNRSRTVLHKNTREPRDAWIRVRGAWPALISRALFEQVRTVRASYMARHRMSDEQILAALRSILARRGRLSCALIDAEPDGPGASRVVRRFGSMRRAYALIGYEMTGRQHTLAERITPHAGHPRSGYGLSDDDLLERIRDLWRGEGRLSCELIDAEPGIPGATRCRSRFGSMPALYERLGYTRKRRGRAAPVAWAPPTSA